MPHSTVHKYSYTSRIDGIPIKCLDSSCSSFSTTFLPDTTKSQALVWLHIGGETGRRAETYATAIDDQNCIDRCDV